MCVSTDHDQTGNTGFSFIALVILFTAILITLIGCGDQPKTIPTVDDSTDVTSNVLVAPSQNNNGTVTPVISGVMPTTPSFPTTDTFSVEGNRPFFDEFSWQMFIALSWPVVNGQPGVPQNPKDPNEFLKMSNSSPVVWTSYKNQYDLFGTKNPTPWGSNTGQTSPVSGNTNHVFLASINAQSIMHGEADESFSVPLIDQNKNYALFEIRYNEVQYDFLFDNKLYLINDLGSYLDTHGDTIAMPASTSSKEGSIMVKAAWRTLTGNDDPSRYYVIDELVYDPVVNKNVKMKMGLVGFHIAQKVGAFPQWIWSSFEQVDNVGESPISKKPYSFNNGTNVPPTVQGYANKPDSTGLNKNKTTRTPVQVSRLNKIPTTPVGQSTVDLNALYQAAVGDNWMKHYELVITQWPSNPTQFVQSSKGGIYPGDSGGAFPVNGCANTTMETYFQSQSDAAGLGNSCMNCHYQANNMDYSWSLFLRSHQAPN